MTQHRTRLAYRTALGRAYESSVEDFLQSKAGLDASGSGTLLLTSPPYPLRKKKKYGNLEGDEYLEWIGSVFAKASQLLAPQGSLVVEIGNAWDPGQPTMSTLPLRTLINIGEETGFQVCQQFICHNTARLPGPAQWVTIERRRVKDTYTHVWWFSKDPYVPADNRTVVEQYSESMEKLLRTKKYNSGERPSGWRMNETSFLKDHGGAIPGNVLLFSNTNNDSSYRAWCQDIGVTPHPARMPKTLAQFFIDFLTKPGDLVIDIFAGSNTTGYIAEASGRQWLAVERDPNYLLSSLGRFASHHSTLIAQNAPYREARKLLQHHAQ
jgi:site-specific DNA-methyltransferase (cytosine-N4-specific)